MATRSRLALRNENDVTNNHKLIDGKMVAYGGKAMQQDAAVKRGALGDIGNRFLANQILDKDKKTAFKEVKPKVDSRWKKTTAVLKDSAAVKKAVTKDPAKPIVPKAIVTRQSSKPESIHIKKDKTIKPSTAASIFGKTAGIFDIKKEIATKTATTVSDQPTLLFKGTRPIGLLKIKRDEEKECHSQKLLSQVDNIDKNDRANPQLASVYVNDIYAYLYKLEDIFPIKDGFLSNQSDVTSKMRGVLLDWINEVHFQFSLENETYHMAVSILDRYLQAVSSTSRKQLQLVGVTALYLASKYEEVFPPDINDFVYVTDDTYSKSQILEMEKKIFQTMGFNLSKPLPIHFLRRFSKAAGHLGDRQYSMSKYFIELASVEYSLAHHKPSEIAAASLLLSTFILNDSDDQNDLACLDRLWTPTLIHYSPYQTKDLKPILKKLAPIVKGAKDAKLKAVYTKYSNSQFKFISTLPQLYGGKIDTIINS